MKDHFGFLQAASLVSALHPESRFLLVGKGMAESEPALTNLIGQLNLAGRVLLLGERTDTPQLTAGLDIACSSSAWGEGFSNAIGEAMACGVPSVVTDVGDSAYLVGDTGRIVPPRNADALAHAIGQLIETGPAKRKELGMAARRRIESEFSLPRIARRYENLYKECLTCPH
jgi:glycosyltransferase involved in cell wall biosynthesis